MPYIAPDYLPFGAAPDIELRVAASAGAHDEVLEFIRERFDECYGARVDDDAPLLVGGYDPGGALVAAFALRDRSAGFFCERYLDATLPDALSTGLRRPVPAREVVEVAHLCAIRPGALCTIMPASAAALFDRGYRYVACTATARLASYFQRKGLTSVVLGEASPAHLAPEERAQWGSYYETRPTVIAGTLDGVPDRLQARAARLGVA